MKQRNQLFLHFRRQINQQIAAAQNVELGEGRIHDQVLRRKDHQLANLLAHLVTTALFLRKEPLQPFFGNLGGDRRGKYPEARLVNRVPVKVGGKDLHRAFRPGFEFFHRLFKHDGQRVGFLASGTTGHPGADRLRGRTVGQQGRNRLGPQLFPDGRFAKKMRDPDQQFLEQQVQLLRVLLQIADIRRHFAELMNPHAPLDATIESAPLVEGKIVPTAGAEQHDHFFQDAVRLVFGDGPGPGDQRGALQVSEELAGQRFDGSRKIGQPGVHDGARHAFKLGRGGVLHQYDTRPFLDGSRPQSAIGAHPGKDHANAALLPVLRQRVEKGINRQPPPARGRRGQQVQHPVQNGKILVRRDDIRAVGTHASAIPDLGHGHAGGALEQFGHDPLVGRIEVLDDDERHAAGFRHVIQEMLQGLETAGRGADADDGEGGLAGGGGQSGFDGLHRQAPPAWRRSLLFHSHSVSIIHWSGRLNTKFSHLSACRCAPRPFPATSVRSCPAAG